MSLNHITQSALKDQSLPGRLETLKNLEEANLLTQVKEWGVFIFFEFKDEPLNWMKCKNCKEFLNAARGGHRT
uniref:Uncharacterized protein n=2 Tax=Caenorhabditis japonica TaxID=281687 RepID=A0A8R1IWN7_CAEJA